MNRSFDITQDQLDFLEALQATGQYRSRSEVLRDLLRRVQFEWEWRKGMAQAKREGWSEDIDADRDAAYATLKKRLPL